MHSRIYIVLICTLMNLSIAVTDIKMVKYFSDQETMYCFKFLILGFQDL